MYPLVKEGMEDLLRTGMDLSLDLVMRYKSFVVFVLLNYYT